MKRFARVSVGLLRVGGYLCSPQPVKSEPSKYPARITYVGQKSNERKVA